MDGGWMDGLFVCECSFQRPELLLYCTTVRVSSRQGLALDLSSINTCGREDVDSTALCTYYCLLAQCHTSYDR